MVALRSHLAKRIAKRSEFGPVGGLDFCLLNIEGPAAPDLHPIAAPVDGLTGLW